MSIIRNKTITLENIVTTADIIVEVEALEGYEEAIKIESNNASNPIPDFIKRGIVFHVKHVLKNTHDIVIPEKIKVPTHNWRRSLSQHKARYTNGPDKSFTVEVYETQVKSMEAADILFLHEFQNTYNLIARNAFESSEMGKKIATLIGLTGHN